MTLQEILASIPRLSTVERLVLMGALQEGLDREEVEKMPTLFRTYCERCHKEVKSYGDLSKPCSEHQG